MKPNHRKAGPEANVALVLVEGGLHGGRALEVDQEVRQRRALRSIVRFAAINVSPRVRAVAALAAAMLQTSRNATAKLSTQLSLYRTASSVRWQFVFRQMETECWAIERPGSSMR